MYRGPVSKWGGLDSPPHDVHLLGTPTSSPTQGSPSRPVKKISGYTASASHLFSHSTAAPRSFHPPHTIGVLPPHCCATRSRVGREETGVRAPHTARGSPHPFAAHRSACAARLRSASAIAAAEKGALGYDTFFLGHHSPKYFLTAGHLRCLAGRVPWRVSLDGGKGREEGGEARRAPLPLGV